MKATIKQPDGTVIELDGTEAEIAPLIAGTPWPAPPNPWPVFVPTPCARPHVGDPWTFEPWKITWTVGGASPNA